MAAEDWAHSTIFQEDLFRLETDGAALWDGVAEIYVRPALPEEESKWQASWGRALLRGDAEEGDDSWVAFLVPVVDPTDHPDGQLKKPTERCRPTIGSNHPGLRC